MDSLFGVSMEKKKLSACVVIPIVTNIKRRERALSPEEDDLDHFF